MEKQNNFKPYIPAEKITPEITVTSIIVGILLAVIFGAANAYLGLRVGMTVSASIPAAVIAMGVIRVVMRKNSILESNIVQTIGSAGESLAAGAIFTLPALYLWAKDDIMDVPSMLTITIIALIGGLLGVFFMIPLRNALIVREHGVLPYPEGQACAEVMLAGEESGSKASTVFAGMGISAFFKFIINGLKLVPDEVTYQAPRLPYPAAVGTQIYPAVMSVGYICGPRISSYMFAGGLLSWAILVPIFVLLAGNTVLFESLIPADFDLLTTRTVNDIMDNYGASGVWKSYVRYIGAGALAAGGIISLVKNLPLIARTFVGALKGFSVGGGGTARTEKDINMKIVLIAILVLTLAVWLVPAIPVSLVGAFIVVIFGFFFATVSSRMVGIVGSSNNPVSGMAIATLLIATLILKFTGERGSSGMQAAIAIGSIICIVAAIAGDTSQDLKTGYLLGATPKKQQIGEIIGVVASALAIGVTLNLLDSAWGFDSEELSAPQATMMQLVVKGVMDGNLPWALILVGVGIAIVVELIGVPVLAFAIGVYLPVQLNACIMVGGIVRLFVDRIKNEERRKLAVNNGILFGSGMIAGEGIVGLLLAILAVVGVDKAIDLSGVLNLPTWASNVGSLVVFGLIIACLVLFAVSNKDKKKA